MANSKKGLKDFNIDFDEVEITTPKGENYTVSITDLLVVNHQVPAAVLKNLSECSSQYARFGILRENIISYKEMLQDRFEEFDRRTRSKARKKNIDPRASEAKIGEAAFLSDPEEYKRRTKALRNVKNLEGRIHRIMRAFEMQAESLRTVASHHRKESSMSLNDDSTIKSGSLGGVKNKK